MHNFDTEGAAASGTDTAAVTLQSLIRRPLETCLPTASTRAAMQAMRSLRIGAMVVIDEGHRPLGILTLRDVVDRIVLEPHTLDAPIVNVMSGRPVCLSLQRTAYEAARLMVRSGVRHVILVDAESRAAGIVSERDLFGMQTTGVRHLSLAIRSARDLSEVEAYGQEILAVARTMLRQGSAVGPLTAFISSLIDLLTERLVQLELEREDPGCDLCWIVMGSEGRSEQTLSTDQDNGLVFRARAGGSADALRARLLPLARRINEALDRAGFRLCPGNIMASNALWCASSDEWRAKFAGWIDAGSPAALLHGAIFFDLRGLTGEVALASELRAWLLERAVRNPRFLHQMAANAMRTKPALGRWLRRFQTDASGRIDLKMHAATPFIDAARIMSLATSVDEVRTESRLSLAAERMGVNAPEADAWIAAFYQVQSFRLHHQLRCIDRGVPADNLLRPNELHEFDQCVLRLALEQGHELQRRLALDHSL